MKIVSLTWEEMKKQEMPEFKAFICWLFNIQAEKYFSFKLVLHIDIIPGKYYKIKKGNIIEVCGADGDWEIIEQVENRIVIKTLKPIQNFHVEGEIREKKSI